MKIKQYMFRNQQITSILLICLSICYLGLTLLINKHVYLGSYNPKVMKEKYDNSQWNQSQNISPLKAYDEWAIARHYSGWSNYVDANKSKINIEKKKQEIIEEIRNKAISDAQLYTYVGYEYVKGANPALLNPEHPPLGKILIGLSILIFQNEHIILLIAGIISLAAIYAILFFSTKNTLIASIGVFLTSIQSLFIDQLIHGPQLELFQLSFFLLLLLCILLYEKRGKKIHLVSIGICYGLLLSTKTFFTFYPLWLLWIVSISYFSKRIKIKEFLFIQIIGVLIFVFTYFRFFMLGGTIKSFLGLQKYIIMFYDQSGISIDAFFGNYLRLIFTGYWKFWSDGSPVTFYNQWSPLWPILFTIVLFIVVKTSKNKRSNLQFPILSSLFILYNIFLFFVPMFPRYLLLLFVVGNILIAQYISTYVNTHAKN